MGRRLRFIIGPFIAAGSDERGPGGQVTGPQHPGRLSHCYRCDNITLHSDTFAHAPKALTKSSRPRSGVSHSMGLSVRGRRSYAPAQRSVRGLRHHVECPQIADAVIEAPRIEDGRKADHPVNPGGTGGKWLEGGEASRAPGVKKPAAEEPSGHRFLAMPLKSPCACSL